MISSIPFKGAKRTLVTRFIKDAGLGNQFFEFAAGYAMSRKLGMHFTWEWEPSKHRDFGLTHFGIAENEFKRRKPVCPPLAQGNPRGTDMIEFHVSHCEDEEVCIMSPFQYEGSFDLVATEVRKLFRLEPLKLDVPAGKTPVAVQVRRGDYVKHKALNVTSPTYFRNAMDVIRKHVSEPHFFVISDDPAYCRKAFEGCEDITIMPPQSPFEGLRTMAACEAHIISNSTFGWWGAWLSEKGPVVAPHRWHQPGANYGDWEPVPARWLRASVTVPETFLEEPTPVVKRAIVYPWKAVSARWEELRYSMRSVLANFEDKDCPIYVIGSDRPMWLIKHPRVQFLDRWDYGSALALGVQLADEVLWMNDDILMLKPTTWADCAVPKYLKQLTTDFARETKLPDNGWQKGVLRVLSDLALHGITDLRLYSTHTPYVYLRERALSMFRKYGIWQKMPLEMAYFNEFPEGSIPLGNMKADSWPVSEDAQYLNLRDDLLTDDMKRWIHGRFPDRAPWELRIPYKVV